MLAAVSLTGALDGSAAPEVRRALLRALAGADSDIVVDVAGATAVDESAARLLLAASRHARAVGATLVLRRPQPLVRHTLEALTGSRVRIEE
jgi:anti-anti-sigma factor